MLFKESAVSVNESVFFNLFFKRSCTIYSSHISYVITFTFFDVESISLYTRHIL